MLKQQVNGDIQNQEFRIEGGEGQEEQGGGNHSDHTGHHAGCNGFLTAFAAGAGIQQGSYDAQIVGGIDQTVREPSGFDLAQSKVSADLGAPFYKYDDKEQRVHSVKHIGPESKYGFHGLGTGNNDHADQDGQNEGADPTVQAQHSLKHIAGGGHDHAQHHQAGCNVDDLIGEGELADEGFCEAVVVVNLEDAGELKSCCADNAPDNSYDNASQKTTQNAVYAEILSHLRTSAVATADDHRLEQEAGQHNALPFIVFY